MVIIFKQNFEFKSSRVWSLLPKLRKQGAVVVAILKQHTYLANL